MSRPDTHGLDTLAEGSQYALEQLQLSQQAATSNPPPADGNQLKLSDPAHSHVLSPHNKQNGVSSEGKLQHDALADSRSKIRKGSSANAVRRRITRACDQCNQLRTKCDGQQPCAHCAGMLSDLSS